MSDEDQSSSASSFGLSPEDTEEFAKLVVKLKMTSRSEVRECLKHQRGLAKQQQYRSLDELLVEQGHMTASQAKRVISEFENKPSKRQIPGYQILSRVGKGAMATVYRARQISLDRIVAIKVLPRRYSENAEFVDRFYREGKAAAKLNHRNIVQAIDVGGAGGYHYFVMEYVDGHTVFDVLTEHHRYSEADAVNMITQIANALAHAHARGLVHRDVKPKNIMITPDGVAKLADMGLAREVTDTRLAKSEAGRAFGTPYYISPEQIRGEIDIDYRADIYSLGATFYHTVTGQVPYDAPNPTAVMIKHLREQLTPPDHINPELSIGCAEIIEIMMAKDRNDRYQSTQEMLEDLRAVGEGRSPIHARAIFDMGELAHLEDGESPGAGALAAGGGVHGHSLRWKLTITILIVLLFLSIMINIFQVLD